MGIQVVNKRNHKSNTVIDVYIGRPSILGNPFPIGTRYNREECIREYDIWITKKIEDHDLEVCRELDRIANLNRKYGKVNLICYCAPLACHGDIIKRIVERR